MGNKFGGLILGLAPLLAAPAAAQDSPKVELSLGYSYVRANPAASFVDGFNMNGASASIAGNVNDWFGVVADFGAYDVSELNGLTVGGNVITYLFGPRVS